MNDIRSESLSEETYLVTNIQRYSINDGPGIRTTIFLKGCPLHCAWCHNPENIHPYQEFFYNSDKCVRCGRCAEVCPQQAVTPPRERRFKTRPDPPLRSLNVSPSEGDAAVAELAEETVEFDFPKFDRDKCDRCFLCVDACEHGALYLASRPMTIDEMYREAKSDELFYESSGGGITLSGSEPLLHPDVIISLFKRARQDGIHTVLDTTAYAKWETIERVLPYVDLFLLDIKAMDDRKHKKWTGVSNRLILENARKLARAGADMRLRMVIVHNVNYWEPDHARQVVKFAGELGKSVSGIDIIPYHNFAEIKYERLGLKYVFKGFPNLFNEDVEDYRKIVAENGQWNSTVGGLMGAGKK